MPNLKAYNATMWSQPTDTWDRLGVDLLSTEPQLYEIHGDATEGDIFKIARDHSERAKNLGADAVIIGGLTGLSMLIGVLAHLEGMNVLEPMIVKKTQGSPVFGGYRNYKEVLDGIATAFLAAWAQEVRNENVVRC